MSEIVEYTSTEMIEKLNSGQSVLKMLGANNLKREIVFAGVFCKMLADYICIPKNDNDLRDRAISVLNKLTPVQIEKEFPKGDGALIIGFNHPSLGEIFRLLIIGFSRYKDREFLFPVNLPWYEAMVAIIPKLNRLRITITPMITPSTEAKLFTQFCDDESKLKQIQYIKNVFERRYMRIARDAAEHENIIFVAPSATRQAKVIGDHIHPTMTLLAHMVYKKPDTKASFLPVAVIEPKNNNRKINLFKKYILSPCKLFPREFVEEKTNKSREFDLLFLQRIEAERNRVIALNTNIKSST